MHANGKNVLFTLKKFIILPKKNDYPSFQIYSFNVWPKYI